MTGALLALTSLQQEACTPILNLRHLNPYVEAAFGDWGSRGGISAMVPRQLMPGPHLPAHDSLHAKDRHEDPTAGTSSFGMSGVNAHMIMTSPSTPHPATGTPEAGSMKHSQGAAFQRTRVWGAPRAHTMLAKFTMQPAIGAQADAVLQGRLDAPRLAFLWEHEVMGRPLLAGAAMLEAGLAAVGAVSAAAARTAITEVSIMAPYMLPKIGGGHVSCHISLR